MSADYKNEEALRAELRALTEQSRRLRAELRASLAAGSDVRGHSWPKPLPRRSERTDQAADGRRRRRKER